MNSTFETNNPWWPAWSQHSKLQLNENQHEINMLCWTVNRICMESKSGVADQWTLTLYTKQTSSAQHAEQYKANLKHKERQYTKHNNNVSQNWVVDPHDSAKYCSVCAWLYTDCLVWWRFRDFQKRLVSANPDSGSSFFRLHHLKIISGAWIYAKKTLPTPGASMFSWVGSWV